MFWRSRSEKKKRKYTRKPPKTLKQILGEAFSKQLEKNPDLLNNISLKHGVKELGLEFEKESQIEQRKREIESKIVDRAFRKIEENPELAEQFVETQIGKIIGEDHYEGRYSEDASSAIRRALDELEDVEEFKKKLGSEGKGSALGGLIDSETVKEIVKLIRASVLASKGIPSEEFEEPTVVVRHEGKLKRIPESQFNQLVEQGRIQPIGVLEAPKPSKEEAPPEIEPEPELPEFISTYLETIAGMLELSPEAAVDQLQGEMEAGLEHSQFIWGFLTTATVDGVAQLVGPYRSHSVVGIYVEKLTSDEGKAWLEEVIRLIKETVGEEEE